MISGQVGILFDNVMTAKPHVDGGRLKGIAISSQERSSIVPDIPTVSESGLPGFDSANWFGLFGPAGVPPPIAQRIDMELNKILRDPAVKERFHTLGFEVTGGSGADLTKVMRSEAAKWSKVIRDANVKAE
jgi:tripartite-type tricarboxylate transporter receptor subunit TctC